MGLLTGVIITTVLASVLANRHVRLDPKVRPSDYTINIRPYFDTGDDNAFKFTGIVNIIFKATAPGIKQIKLHAESLEFDDRMINILPLDKNVSNVVFTSNPLFFDVKNSLVYFNLRNSLETDTEYSISITYRGFILKDVNRGFFSRSYEIDGQKKWMATTQLEMTYARRVFPCFDEPEYKARFTLVMHRPEHFSPTLFNTKLQHSVAVDNGYVRETFFPTPIMSTYLVAFVISEFQHGAKYDSGDRQFGVWVRPDVTNQTDYAFDIGKRVVATLSDYTTIDYYSVDENLNLNHIGIPSPPFLGAMENWGLITYKENYLLYEPKECSLKDKIAAVTIITHETAHQWFGNLVTCHWWTDFWLNESFAAYFQYYIASLVEPGLGLENDLITDQQYKASTHEATRRVSPLSSNAINADHVIIYNKGAAVLRMMHHLIGDEGFKLGLQSHLNTGWLGTVNPVMLYNALQWGVEKTSSFKSYPGYRVSDVMVPWVTQAGQPVVHVTLDPNTNEITITQYRHYQNNQIKTGELYPIPITYTTQSKANFNNTKPAFIMADRTYAFGKIPENEWIIFNIQETGYYRVNYDEQLWRRIGEALKGEERTKIHHLNRAKIVNDLFAFYFADSVSKQYLICWVSCRARTITGFGKRFHLI